MSPKDWGAELLWRLGVTTLLARLPRGYVTVLAYHRIRAHDGGGAHPFDDGVVGPTVSRFREQIHWLTEHAQLIDEAQLRCFVEQRGPLPPNGTLLTFDDAYRDNFDLAFPILQAFRVPAIFFVPTALIETRTLGWWDTIAYFIKHTTRRRIVLEGRTEPVAGHRQALIAKLHEHVKRSKTCEVATLLAQLSVECDVPFPSRAHQDAELMTWDQIREVSRNGIAIGSHTHTHRVLTTLDGDEVRAELATSKALLEARIGQPVYSLAYPCGGPGTFDRRSQALAEECGYRLAFSFTAAVNDASTLSPFDVWRVAAPPRLSRLAATVLLPRIFSLASSARAPR